MKRTHAIYESARTVAQRHAQEFKPGESLWFWGCYRNDNGAENPPPVPVRMFVFPSDHVWANQVMLQPFGVGSAFPVAESMGWAVHDGLLLEPPLPAKCVGVR